MTQEENEISGAVVTPDAAMNRMAEAAASSVSAIGFIWVTVGLLLGDMATQPVRFCVASVKDNWGWLTLTQEARDNGAQVVAPGGFNMGLGDGLMSALYVAWLRLEKGVNPASAGYKQIEAYFDALFTTEGRKKFVVALVEGGYLRIGNLDDTGSAEDRLAYASAIMEGDAPAGLNSLADLALKDAWFSKDSAGKGSGNIPALFSSIYAEAICKVTKSGKAIHIADPEDYL